MSDRTPEEQICRELVVWADRVGVSGVREAGLGETVFRARKVVSRLRAAEAGIRTRTKTEVRLGADDYEAVVQIAVAMDKGTLHLLYNVDAPAAFIVPIYAGLKARVDVDLAIDMASRVGLALPDFREAAEIIIRGMHEDDVAALTGVVEDAGIAQSEVRLDEIRKERGTPK